MALTTYGRSTGFCIDPIEKKPLNHFYPGTPVLSFGTAGCNLGCKFCQNWDISKSREVERLSAIAEPDQIANAALNTNCTSVAYTYNDPIIWAEYAIDNLRSRGFSFFEANDQLFFLNGNALFPISVGAAFDDDLQSEKENALASPLVSFPQSEAFGYLDWQLAENGGLNTIFDNVWYAVNTLDISVSTRDITEAGVSEKELLLSTSNPLLLKRYDNDDFSVVSFDNNAEITTLQRTPRTVSIGANTSQRPPYINYLSQDGTSWHSETFRSNAAKTIFRIESENLLSIPLYDARYYFNHEEDPDETLALLYAEDQDNGGAIPLLTSPSLFQYSGSADTPLGNKMAEVNANVVNSENNRISVFADDYGLAILDVVVNGEIETKYYYFDPVNTVTEAELPSEMIEIPLP